MSSVTEWVDTGHWVALRTQSVTRWGALWVALRTHSVAGSKTVLVTFCVITLFWVNKSVAIPYVLQLLKVLWCLQPCWYPLVHHRTGLFLGAGCLRVLPVSVLSFKVPNLCCKTFASGCNNGQICLLEVLETQLDMSAVPLKDPILVSILSLIILEAEIFGWENYHQTVVRRWPIQACSFHHQIVLNLLWIVFVKLCHSPRHAWQFQLQLGASTSPSDGASLRETYSESSSRPIFPFMQFPFANRSFHPQKIRYCVFFQQLAIPRLAHQAVPPPIRRCTR